MANDSKTGAAQAVLEWLDSEPYERKVAKRYAHAGPQYLANWARENIYPPSFLHLHPDDARRMIDLRDSFTREEFDRIDWPSVWQALTRGECPSGNVICSPEALCPECMSGGE